MLDSRAHTLLPLKKKWLSSFGYLHLFTQHLLNNLFLTDSGRTPSHPFLNPSKSDTAFSSTAKSSSVKFFPTHPAEQDASAPLGLVQQILVFYRPHDCLVHSRWQQNVWGRYGNVAGGGLLQGYSLLTEVGSGPAIPEAFPSLSVSQYLANQTRTKVGEVDRPTPHITYLVLAGAWRLINDLEAFRAADTLRQKTAKLAAAIFPHK